MSKLIMFDFECTNGHQFEDLVKSDVHELDCPVCAAKAARQISAVRLDWRKMGLDPGFPSAQDKWAKAQTKAKQKGDTENLVMY
jgi:putative FmdB family regulatory protein